MGVLECRHVLSHRPYVFRLQCRTTRSSISGISGLTSWSPGGAGDGGGEVKRLLHLRAVGHQAAAAKVVGVEGGPAVGPVELSAQEIDQTILTAQW